MIRRLLPFLILPLFLSCITQERSVRRELIAHAGGVLDGYVYTNSLEALQHAVENGYKFIEVDLIMSADSVLVAAHSWEDFNRMTGNAHRGDSAMMLEQFVEQRIHGRYTPMTAAMVNDFFMSDTSLYLVTDKTSEPVILAEYFPNLKQRMVVEAFTYEHYQQLVDGGYFRVLYSCMAEDFASAITRNLMFDKLFSGKRIDWIALHTSGFSYPMFKLLDRMRRFNIALFTVDNYNELHPWQLERVKMIYTNTLLPVPDTAEIP
ncbi:MAG: hypothetical protein IJ513_03665 [Bacteroidaceae bacterium]|nr:hypothetical protein [Bacteroidaceae bacterium]